MVLRFEGVRRPVDAGRWVSCCCCWSEVLSRDREGGRWIEVMVNERVPERPMDDVVISEKTRVEEGKVELLARLCDKSYRLT